MHDGQVDLTPDQVASAVAGQVPELAGLPVDLAPSAGTVVAPWRLGESFVARIPLVPHADAAARARLQAELDEGEALAGRLPVEVARPVALGEPFEGYPGWWSVWTWVRGESLDALLYGPGPDAAAADGSAGRVALDQVVLARDLGRTLRAYRDLPAAATWTGGGRGGEPLSDSDWVRTSIERSAHLVDRDAATAVWERALTAPACTRPVRIHADALPGNLIVRDGRLAGLIDVSTPVTGDPASDLQPAWAIFDEPARSVFAAELGLDEAAWERGRGWAFEMAVGGLHYYERTNPTFFTMCRRTLERLLETR